MFVRGNQSTNQIQLWGLWQSVNAGEQVAARQGSTRLCRVGEITVEPRVFGNRWVTGSNLLGITIRRSSVSEGSRTTVTMRVPASVEMAPTVWYKSGHTRSELRAGSAAYPSNQRVSGSHGTCWHLVRVQCVSAIHWNPAGAVRIVQSITVMVRATMAGRGIATGNGSGLGPGSGCPCGANACGAGGAWCLVSQMGLGGSGAVWCVGVYSLVQRPGHWPTACVMWGCCTARNRWSVSITGATGRWENTRSVVQPGQCPWGHAGYS